MDLIKEYMSSSPQSSPPEALREPPCPHECPELEVSILSSSVTSERKEPVACSTPDMGFEVSAGDKVELLSGSPGHTPYPYKKNVAPRRLFKRARVEDTDTESPTSDSSSLMLPPPPPPFNSPAEGYEMPDEFTASPRTKARKLRVAIENASASEVLREGSPRSESPELEVSVASAALDDGAMDEPSGDAELLPPSSHRFRLLAAAYNIGLPHPKFRVVAQPPTSCLRSPLFIADTSYLCEICGSISIQIYSHTTL